MRDNESSLEITVAATENSLRIFEVDGPEAPNGAPWEELPKAQLRADPKDTLRDVLERASAQLGIKVSEQTRGAIAQFRAERGEEHRDEGVVDRLAFAEFRCPDDDEVVNEHGTLRRSVRLGPTSVVAVRDELGRVTWKRPPFEATMAELVDAAEAGLIEGDPLQPYLVLVVPQGDLGIWEWQHFTETLRLLWEVSDAMGRLGGAWAFVELVRRVVKRRNVEVEKAVKRNAKSWNERGATPSDLLRLLRQKARGIEEVASLLGCATGEAEALLWGLGYAESEGLWHWRGDAAAQLIADDVELGSAFANYRGKDKVRPELERRLSELGEKGEAKSYDEEKQEMLDELRRKAKEKYGD